MKDEKNKNPHEGHRARTIDNYSRLDLCELSPHQVLEYILFFVFPRCDVNVLAHRLLDRYNTVQNVLDANEFSLKEIEGINDRSAKMITGFVKIFDYYMNSKMSKKTKLNGWGDVYDLCENLVRFHTREILYGIALDSSFRIIRQRKLGTGTFASVVAAPNLVCDFINETKAAFIILTHNHPGGICKPSDKDISGTEELKQIIKVMKANFIDHIVVGSDGVYSIEFNKKVRSFVDKEDVKSLTAIYE